jgi:glycosyltransferase involved in cell wall biosynthesis
MRIAFVDQPWAMALPPVRNGSISLWTWQVARRLARRHAVLVYEGSTRRSRPRVVRCEGVEYRTFWVAPDDLWQRTSRRLVRRVDPQRPPVSAATYYLGYAFRAAMDIRRERCDVVHVHQCPQFASVIRAVNPRARILLHMNCEWLTQFDPAVVKRRLHATDLILGCSDYITGLIREAYPSVAARCSTVYNGVDVERFAPPPDGGGRERPGIARLVFVGRVSPEKGVHDLIDAFAIVAKRRPNVELHIVGPEDSLPIDFIVGISADPLVRALSVFYQDGDYSNHLRRRIDLSLAGRVTFVGKVPNDLLPAHYHSADILINPSLSESFGMTVAEAMACGKPVIVTNVGGMPGIVRHGVDGLVVPPANVEALADAILHLVDRPELRTAMGVSGRQRIADLCSWESVADAWLACCGAPSLTPEWGKPRQAASESGAF